MRGTPVRVSLAGLAMLAMVASAGRAAATDPLASESAQALVRRMNQLGKGLSYRIENTEDGKSSLVTITADYESRLDGATGVLSVTVSGTRVFGTAGVEEVSAVPLSTRAEVPLGEITVHFESPPIGLSVPDMGMVHFLQLTCQRRSGCLHIQVDNGGMTAEDRFPFTCRAGTCDKLLPVIERLVALVRSASNASPEPSP